MSQNTNIRTPDEGPTSPDGLKAERIQEALTGENRLKAERIQLTLQGLPGWRLQRSGRQIARTVDAKDVRDVARLLRFVADLGQAAGHLPDVIVRSGEVTFALPTLDGGVYVTRPCFELAHALSRK